MEYGNQERLEFKGTIEWDGGNEGEGVKEKWRR